MTKGIQPGTPFWKPSRRFRGKPIGSLIANVENADRESFSSVEGKEGD